MVKHVEVAHIPSIGFARLKHIIGDSKSHPPIPPIIPVGKSSWWKGISENRFPKPIRVGRTTCWRWEDIHTLVRAIEAGKAWTPDASQGKEQGPPIAR